METGHLFCFGLGFTARALANVLRAEGWRVSGTTRTERAWPVLRAAGIEPHRFSDEGAADAIDAILPSATAVLVSVPPGAAGDPVLNTFGARIAALPALRWLGYLSTTGVYGDTAGRPVAEDAPLRPTSARSRRRVDAERAWLALQPTRGVPVHVFRLAGIYGPGRSVLERIEAGDARRIDRPGHAFSRIHVEDAAAVLRASIARPEPGGIYNVADDEPAEPSAVIAYACRLLGREPPALVPFEAAADEMSAMARSFWQDNRKVDNARIKHELGVRLRYADFRAGLQAIVAGTHPGGREQTG
jgi:nucleoside-diphosphate-sugar epimerase